jgi:hypothetical protein
LSAESVGRLGLQLLDAHASGIEPSRLHRPRTRGVGYNPAAHMITVLLDMLDMPRCTALATGGTGNTADAATIWR